MRWEVGSFKNGAFRGGWKEYFDNGRLMTKGRYKQPLGEPNGNGIKVGRWFSYYENGQLAGKTEWSHNGYLESWECYKPNGESWSHSIDGDACGWFTPYRAGFI